MFSYTELWTEDAMQAFINDELVESQDNPLGIIPFVPIANKKVPSSPWGLSDIQDVTDLNRVYNETATLITDIVNYYASPVTIITGAKSNNLERGPKKVWAIPNEKARVENLELNNELDGPLAYLQVLKNAMHELVGIPVNALGQAQAISNTSGVALSLQFLPLMQKFRQKTTQYASGLARVNEIIIRVAALYMPELLSIDPDRDPPIEDGQLTQLDPRDPLSFRNTVEFASPLPIDELIVLNTLSLKMQLGLESKAGALRELGNAYPAEKMQELLEELHMDAMEQGALDLLNTQIRVLIQMITGIDPSGDAGGGGEDSGSAQAGGVTSAGGPDVNSAGDQPGRPQSMAMDPDVKDIYNQLNTLAQGTKLPQIRNPFSDPSD